MTAMDLEFARFRALEAEDRLLLISDGEDGPGLSLALVDAFACEEFFRQPRDDGPLLGARILCLIDQHVIEAAIKLEEHPLGGLAPFEKTLRRQDQIVIIEKPTGAFRRFVFAARSLDEREGRFGQERNMRGASPFFGNREIRCDRVERG